MGRRRVTWAAAGMAAAVAVAVLSVAVWAAPGRPRLADRSPGAVPVDVELVLAVDVSYSMDPDEQALQREGYAMALTSKEFMQALREGANGKIAVTYIEWAGQTDQTRRGAVAADRRSGIGRRGRRRDRGGALPPRLAHLDFWRIGICQAACSTIAAIAAFAVSSTSPVTAPTIPDR